MRLPAAVLPGIPSRVALNIVPDTHSPSHYADLHSSPVRFALESKSLQVIMMYLEPAWFYPLSFESGKVIDETVPWLDETKLNPDGIAGLLLLYDSETSILIRLKPDENGHWMAGRAAIEVKSGPEPMSRIAYMPGENMFRAWNSWKNFSTGNEGIRVFLCV